MSDKQLILFPPKTERLEFHIDQIDAISLSRSKIDKMKQHFNSIKEEAIRRGFVVTEEFWEHTYEHVMIIEKPSKNKCKYSIDNKVKLNNLN